MDTNSLFTRRESSTRGREKFLNSDLGFHFTKATLSESLWPKLGFFVERQCRKTNFFLTALFLGLLFNLVAAQCSFAAAPVQYELRGRVSYRLGTEGAYLVEQEDDFTLSVNGCSWFLTKYPVLSLREGKPTARTNFFRTASSDGTNFYYLTSPYRNVGTTNEDQRANSLATGRIGLGKVPYGIGDTATIMVWYALASGCYLSDLSGDRIYPPTSFSNIGTFSSNFLVQALFSLQNESPHLPKSIVFFGLDKEVRAAEALRGQSAGVFTNCILSVKSYTNFEGFRFPQEVEVAYQTLSFISNAFVHTPGGIIRISIVGASRRCSVETFVPAIGEVVEIADLRTIRSEAPVIGVIASKNWPPLVQTKSDYEIRLQDYQNTVTRKTEDAGKSRNYIRSFRLLIIAILIVPAVWGLLKLKTKSKEKSHEENKFQ
jgi:hypothetical protein